MSRLFGALHKCGVAACATRLPRTQVLCDLHYGLLPRWLQTRLRDARAYGIAWKCHPTQEYLEVRQQAIDLATRELARKHGRPAGVQIPLIPT